MGFNLMDEAASHARTEQNVAALPRLDPSAAAKRAEQEETARQVYEAMIKDNRSWGGTLLLFGVIHLVASGFLSAPYGLLLLAVGGASFLFRDAAMFVIYAVVLAWAALSNALGGSTGWIVFALFQLYLSVRVLQRFFRYRKAQGEIAAVLGQDSPHVPDRAARVFPWMGCILGAFSFAGTIAVIVVIFAYVFAEESNVPQVLDLMMESMVNVGLLAVAVGLASLLSRFRYKGLSILGMVGGLVVLGGVLLLALT